MSRLHNQIMNLLVVDIVTGEREPGERLPPEGDLALEFGVSRGVAREAIRGLEERGLVRVKHGRGSTVTPRHSWNVLDPDVLAALLQSDDRTEVVGELLETRKLIEVECAGLAAERATDEDLTAIAEALARTVSSAQRAARNRAAEQMFVEADVRFHQAILGGAHNRVLSRLMEPVRRVIMVAQSHSRSELRFSAGIHEHTAIAQAIAARDVRAARAAMARHLDSVEEMLLSKQQEASSG
jgi:GntR family transcriptional repressor for pyruvate dehydrogenase complex